MLQIRKTLFLLLLTSIPALSVAQKSGYLKTKDMLYYGALHGLDKPDPTEVVFEFNNGNRRTFKPGDALEFGIEEGEKRWVAKTFEGNVRFYQELVKGKASLLYVKTGKNSNYFLEANGNLIPLEKNGGGSASYRQVLKNELQDCYLTEKTIRLAKYKTANLKYFVSQYNECLHKPFPKFRAGPTVGIKLLNNNIKSKYFPSVAETDEAISIGALMELPLSYNPQILLVLHPTVAKFSFSVRDETYNPQTDVVSINNHHLDHIDLDLPVMLKYRLPFYYASPYIQAGLAAQVGLSTKSYTLTDRIEMVNGQYEVTEKDLYIDSGALASSFFGAVIGAGVEIPVNPYITGILGANYALFNADVETGYNKKRSPEFFIAVTF